MKGVKLSNMPTSPGESYTSHLALSLDNGLFHTTFRDFTFLKRYSGRKIPKVPAWD